LSCGSVSLITNEIKVAGPMFRKEGWHYNTPVARGGKIKSYPEQERAAERNQLRSSGQN
jgi:hypothetical protein